MSPSFESLADRKHDLLEKAQRRVRQNNAKRQMYAEALWVSDGAQSVVLKATGKSADTQTDALMTQVDPLKQASNPP